MYKQFLLSKINLVIWNLSQKNRTVANQAFKTGSYLHTVLTPEALVESYYQELLANLVREIENLTDSYQALRQHLADRLLMADDNLLSSSFPQTSGFSIYNTQAHLKYRVFLLSLLNELAAYNLQNEHRTKALR